MISNDQRKLYWANLHAIYKMGRSAMGRTGVPPVDSSVALESFRAQFHAQHHLPASTKDFTKKDFDAFLAACAAITQPADLKPQLRAFDQPKTRLLGKINWQAAQLKALGVADANAYIAKIAQDKFGKLPADLSDSPRSSHGSRYSQLDNLMFTIQNRIKTLRQERGWTVHKLLCNAGLAHTCECAACRHAKMVGTVAPRGPSRELAADNAPF
jgi:hypothetical protein